MDKYGFYKFSFNQWFSLKLRRDRVKGKNFSGVQYFNMYYPKKKTTRDINFNTMNTDTKIGRKTFDRPKGRWYQGDIQQLKSENNENNVKTNNDNEQ